VVGLLLALAFLGNLAFALTYDIGEIHPFFIANYLVTAVAAGLGLERLVSLAPMRGAAGLVAFALPAGLCASHWTGVVEASQPGKAEPMRALLEEARGGALLIARYEEYVQLLYLTLAERRAGPAVFIAHDVPVEELAAYLTADRPIELRPVRRRVPPGLPVYSTRLALRPQYRAAGLEVRMFRWGAVRVSRPREPGSP
jgi:hypothetical protein